MNAIVNDIEKVRDHIYSRIKQTDEEIAAIRKQPLTMANLSERQNQMAIQHALYCVLDFIDTL